MKVTDFISFKAVEIASGSGLICKQTLSELTNISGNQVLTRLILLESMPTYPSSAEWQQRISMDFEITGPVSNPKFTPISVNLG